MTVLKVSFSWFYPHLKLLLTWICILCIGGHSSAFGRILKKDVLFLFVDTCSVCLHSSDSCCNSVCVFMQPKYKGGEIFVGPHNFKSPCKDRSPCVYVTLEAGLFWSGAC